MTGASTEYSDEDCMALVAALHAAFQRWSGDRGMMEIVAEIEWAGEYNPKKRRGTTMGPLNLTAVRAATNKAYPLIGTMQRVIGQRPVKGWYAQIKELTRTKAGYAAADRAGLDVSKRTLLGWLSQEQTPSKANQAKIEKAVISLQYERAAQARDRAEEAARAAADALSEAVKEKYGSEVRFFNVAYLEFEDPPPGL